MKALVKATAGPGLEMMDVPMPEVGPMDVLIKIKKTSICGTDVHIWKWDAWAQRTIPVPMHVGHEFCGVVESVGSGVTDIVPGELVSGEGHIVCGRCRNCLAGQPRSATASKPGQGTASDTDSRPAAIKPVPGSADVSPQVFIFFEFNPRNPYNPWSLPDRFEEARPNSNP